MTTPDRTGFQPALAVIEATVGLLKSDGQDAIKTRRVAAAAGVSTMAVYTQFGSVAELRLAVADYGFEELDRAFGQIPAGTDPVAKLHALALVFRKEAKSNPHLYDLMFGLAGEASTLRPPLSGLRSAEPSPNYNCAFKHVVEVSRHLVALKRCKDTNAEWIAGQLWAMVHGVVSLELAGHYGRETGDGCEALGALLETYLIGAGDTRRCATSSRIVGTQLFESLCLT